MIYKTSYDSPLGSLLLLADEKGLTGLWFEKQKHFAYGRTGFEADAADYVETCGDGSLPLLSEAERWLDLYFAGKKPDFDLPINLSGTEFQKKVWEICVIVVNGNKRKKICTPNKPLHLQENCFDCVRFSFVKKVEREDFCG